MTIKASQPLLPAERIQELLQLEPALLIAVLALGTLVFYKIFLRTLSAERHLKIKVQFTNLAYHFTAGSILFATYFGLHYAGESQPTVERIATYVGLIALIQEAVVAIKTCRLIIFEYLYFSHMRVPFPLLLVNIFTLLLTLLFSGWLASAVFSVQIAPLMATSAVLSLVMGLALQDTIGNLFAGVALQFDKPYEIDDWIEVQNGGQRWIGQVHEISWRATVLHGMGDETLTIPNKIMSQAQISNFAAKQKPFIRSQMFRLPFESPPTEVKRALLDAAYAVKGIRRDVAPIVFIWETSESWVLYKLIYYIENFGSQYLVADEINESALEQLRKRGLFLASPRIALVRQNAG